MIDIIPSAPGLDLGVLDTQTTRAANILSVQKGSLEYAPDLGIDLRFFLSEDFKFQNESFKAYLIQELANQGINVASLTDSVDALFSTYIINLNAADEAAGFVSR